MSQEAIQEAYRKGWKDRGQKDEVDFIPRLTEVELIGYRRGLKEGEHRGRLIGFGQGKAEGLKAAYPSWSSKVQRKFKKQVKQEFASYIAQLKFMPLRDRLRYAWRVVRAR